MKPLMFALVLFGAIGVVLAYAKDRSVLGGFFAGFFLGIGGLVLFGMLPNGEPKTADEGSPPTGAPRAWWKTTVAS